MNATVQGPRQLRDAWRDLAAGKLRQRDIALRLAVSEAELLASRAGIDDGRGPRVTRLQSSQEAVDALIRGLGTLGPVMALTRNEACVHEKDGPYLDIDLSGHAGLVLGRQIDLRLFHHRWRHAFAVEEEGARGTQHSLQFYLGDGSATHKVFLRPASDVDAWRALRARWASDVQVTDLRVEPLPPTEYPIAEEPDVELFREEWLAMTDTHQFFGMLRRHGLRRTDALRIAPPGHAHRVTNDSATRLLTTAARSGLPIMVFVGNRGCIQIHTGPVVNIRPLDAWINVLDDDFNLHLRTDLIAESWCVAKPTEDGPVNALELFDADGESIATFFGERKPGNPELPGWPALLATLEKQ